MSLRIAVAGVVLGLAGFAVAAPPAKKTGERPPAITVKPGAAGKPDALGPPDGLPPPPGLEDSVETGEPDGEFGDAPPMTPQQREQEFELHILRAQKAERENRVDDAIREYSAALKLQPGDSAALKGRAYLRYKRTKEGQCPKRAIEDLRLLRTYDPRGLWLEQRATLVTWLGQCDTRTDAERLSLALEVADDDPKSPNRPTDIRFTIATLQARQAEAAERERERLALQRVALQELARYRKDCELTGKKPAAEALGLQAALSRALDDPEAAIQIYEELLRRYPGTVAAKQAKKNVDDLKLEVELDKLEKEQGGKPSQAAEAAYTAAVMALRVGDLDTAERELEKAIADSPWFPKAHYVLGIVHARGGQVPRAAEELKISIRMDRFDYEAHMALGLLYKKEFAGGEDEQAIKHLETALLLRPDLYHLHFQLGQLYARIDRERARRSFTRFLDAPIPE
ncbi:MAG: tetratricopeptide repeat protein, partial [Myxococcales bacterium]|nr:tetratricopeptide repeat protein [Myxococcales bacterium]